MIVDGESQVTEVSVTDLEGQPIERSALLEGYTAIDFSTLETMGYVQSLPATSGQNANVDGHVVHNFLWLFKKTNSMAASGADDSRAIVLFKLSSVQILEREGGAADSLTLTYVQVM